LIFIADTSKTDGSGLANLVYNSSGLVAYYFAGDLNNEVQITLVTATLGTYASGGFIAVDNTNMPGWYEIGIPDAALDGGNEVAIQLRGATNMAPVNVYIELDTVDYQTDAFGALKPTNAGRTLDVTATGAAGIDLGNVENPTTTLNLSGTTISTTQAVASVTARVTANVDQWGGVTVTGMPLPTSSYTAPDNATIGTISINLGTVNTNVLSRLAASSYVAPLSASETRSALGLASANLDTQLENIPTTAEFEARTLIASEYASSTHWTATRAGYLDGVLIAANYNQRTVQVTGSNHVAADIHELQPAVITSAAFAAGWLTASGTAADYITELQTALGTATNQTAILDRVSFALSALAGNCSTAQTAAETYTLTIGGNTFTVDYTGLDSSGNRSTTTLSKT